MLSSVPSVCLRVTTRAVESMAWMTAVRVTVADAVTGAGVCATGGFGVGAWALAMATAPIRTAAISATLRNIL